MSGRHDDYHEAHALEAAHAKKLARWESRVAEVQAHEAEVRRMAEERWRRRILPLLPTETALETDYPGCVE